MNVWGIDPAGESDEEAAREGIDALDAWTREMGAYRSLSDLGLSADQVEEVANTIAPLPTALAPLTREDLVALLNESL